MKRFYLSKLTILVAILSCISAGAIAQSTTFNYTGAIQYYTVPSGVTSLAIDMGGAQGGLSASGYGVPGCGGKLVCKLQVTGGQVLNLFVGGVGQNSTGCCSSYMPGGWNGGGTSGYGYGGGGGGATDIRVGGTAVSNRVIVAGGGGGGGGPYCGSGNNGGQGGGLTGQGGLICSSTTYCPCYNATGGSQSAGGIGGTCNGGTTGTQTAGGNANQYGGGGGGGYWGGGGGGYYSGGGGGSSYPAANGGNVTGLTHTQGGNCAAGYITICPGPVAGSIIGATTVCPGGATTTLSDFGGATGGVWSSSNIAIATVNPTTGVVTGVLPGTAVITYSISSSCATGIATTTMTVNPKTSLYNVTSTGTTYCAGTPSIGVGTDGSDVGTDYKLYSAGPTLLSTLSGNGSPLNFGVFGAGTYTVVGTIVATGCALNMAGSAVITSTPLPNVYSLTAAGTAYCTGGTGYAVQLNTSDIGVDYQLYNASGALGSSMAGTGSALVFGIEPAGTYSVVATNSTTGCVKNMSGTPTITMSPLPTSFTVRVAGGGPSSFCAGGVGIPIELSGSTPGVQYQLYAGAMPLGGPVTGTGSVISLGTWTTNGTYTVIASDPATTCTKTMSGSVNVSSVGLPNIYNLTVGGGGSYCAGGAGLDVVLSSTDAGTIYKLLLNGSPIATSTGSGSVLHFGNKTGMGTYTAIATNSFGCSSNMAGSPTININPLPVSTYTVELTPGSRSSYCSGGTGVGIELSYSAVGVSYQLYVGASPQGGAISGTGNVLSFGSQTTGGVYTVRATNSTTGCNSNMTGSVNVSIDFPPATHTLKGGGSYCAGATGLNIDLDGSSSGVSYQLYNSSLPVGSPVAGTGGPITFGPQTLAGSYAAMATNTLTGCTAAMNGAPTVTIKPLPNPQAITGGGGYCAGGTGVAIGLFTTDVGISYQLYNGSTVVGTAIAGTGSAISFGAKTAVGTYTVKASNSVTTCFDFMPGSTNISVNPAPNVYTVSGGGNYCAGTAGADVKLSFSNIGIDYQLYLNGNPVGAPVAGTGAMLDFGLQSGLGSYTVIATNSISGCTQNMSGSVVVTTSPLPSPYTVTVDNGGYYCSGGTGVHVGLSSSNTGISYQLYLGSTPVGSPKNGTNTAIDFGSKTTPGTYSVFATNATTGCSNGMSGSVAVNINPKPNAYSMSGTGTYCAGGSGAVMCLNNSDAGTDYQLYLGTTPVSGALISGTGSPICFLPQPTIGNYTIVATNTSTTCTQSMAGSVTVSTLPLPTVYTVTGGGNYCAGDPGKNVLLSGSNTGISYQLVSGSPVKTMAGTGSSLDFGTFTTTGNYTVVATNTTTSCSVSMASSATIGVNALPRVDTVNGGGTYCSGTGGVAVGLKKSLSSVNYQLYYAGSKLGSSIPGTGGALSFGTLTAAGAYTVKANDPATTCSNDMYGTATINVTIPSTPGITVASSKGLTVCAGDTVTYTTTVVSPGTTPLYQWMVNGTPVTGETNSSYTVVPANGDRVGVTMTSSASCLTAPTASDEVIMAVNAKLNPNVTILVDPATTVCPGTEVTYHAVATGVGPIAPSYSWTFKGASAGSDVFTVLTPANNDVISVTVTTAATCTTKPSVTGTVTMTVTPVSTPANVKLTVTPGKSIIEGQLDTVKANFTAGSAGLNPVFEWLINGVVISGETGDMLIRDDFRNHDSVTCLVTGSGSCGGTTVAASASILVRSTAGVNQLNNSPSDIRVLPNPNKGMFSVKGTLANTNAHDVTLEITNMLGQVVYRNAVTASNGVINEQVQLGGNLANGMYVLSVRSGSENNVFHFVIEQ